MVAGRPLPILSGQLPHPSECFTMETWIVLVRDPTCQPIGQFGAEGLETEVRRAAAKGLLGDKLTRHGTPVILWISFFCLAGSLSLLLIGEVNESLQIGGWIFFAVLWLFALNFFRNPVRIAPQGGQPISPADGKVIGVDLVEDEAYVDGPALRIHIFLSVFNVHVNRIPLDGVIEHLRYIPGEFRNAVGAEAREVNERQEIGLRTTDGVPILVRQIAGLIARRIVCPLQVGEEVERGFDFGMIRFGSQTEIIIPAKEGVPFKSMVKVGDKVHGGKTVLGDWIE
ncbi:MAG: hypothetical protein CBC13_03540 [Planctomycetia bacterium TMED53]|nr:MAG: hypothetical protein CBC13_03540 [Planctomycetia bacterium TMED53]